MDECMKQMDKYIDQTNLFWESFNARDPQVWLLPHHDLYEDEFMIIKLFQEGTSGKTRIIGPPMAGHHSNIAGRVVDYYVKTTDDQVITIEWKAATQETKDYGIEDVVNKIDLAIMVAVGETAKVHLAGLCQGGWAMVMWAALNPDRAESIIIAGTPIDYVIDGGKCQNWLSMVSNGYIKNVINAYDGLWPGKNQLLGFKMLNPMDRFYGTYQKLMELVRDGDLEGIKKWVRNNSWYEYVQDLPGKFILEVCDWLFRENRLIYKELEINGQIVELCNIKCPIVCITGDDDDITLERQCTKLMYYVSTDKENMMHFSIPECGHIAIFLTNEALKRWDAATKFIEYCLEDR